MSNPNFTHMHVHTSYSFLDGYNPIDKLVSRAKELGMTALAITDHNHLGGCVEFQNECKKQDIKPLLGCEMYFTWDTNCARKPVEERNQNAIDKAIEAGILEEGKTSKLKKSDIKDLIAPFKYDMTQYHILLIALNQNGWNNLVKLQSEAADKCTYNGRFLCDDEMLAKYSDDIIMTSACIGNAAAEKIINGDIETAEAQILKWKNIFGDRFYLEIQPLNIKKQWIVNKKYMELAKKHNINTIATNDVHWTLQEDADDHDTLLCIGIGKLKKDIDRMTYYPEFWLKNYDEMICSFKTQLDSMIDKKIIEEHQAEEYCDFYKKSMNNTILLADMVDNNIVLGSPIPLLPKIKTPKGLTAEQYLTSKCFQSLYKYLSTNPKLNRIVYERRLYEELKIINMKGFAPYMLIVEEYVEWANKNGCPTGPGRGSAAGSLTLFLLGVTRCIDPIQYGLLFSRFLTIDRTAMPDIDIDFDYDNRDKVVTHLEDEYGKEKVSHIGTYTVMGVKSGLKDVGRVLDIDFGIMNNISKKLDLIIDKPQPKFKDFDALKNGDMSEQARWKEFNYLETNNKELFRLARAFEGTKRNFGVHASGVLVTPNPVSDLFPTRKSKDGTTVTLYTGTQLEELNAVKLDILGLKTITVINNTLKYINESISFDDLYKAVDVNDPEIFSMIRNKQTDGLFQIESDMFKGMISDIKPDSLNDIIAITSLGRPGPLKAGMPVDYAKRKNGIEEPTEPLRDTFDIVKDTYGCICYQESIMAIAVKVAGFSTNQSDSIVRKIFAKKKKDQMEKLRRMFFYGKINKVDPKNWENESDAPWYDPEGEYGTPILGACNNGYSKKEMTNFWTNIEGFADYLFNKSHAACYSYITILTAYLKKYYPTQFMAALLTMEETDEGKAKYINVAEKMGITISTPDINISGINFTPKNKTILYGLGSIKGIGNKALPSIIENKPYKSIEDALTRIGKKAFNKTVGINLIKAGAFSFIDENRYNLINTFMDIRKDKDDRYKPELFDETVCMNMEKDVLGTEITYKPWWYTVKTGEKIVSLAEIVKVNERTDKNGNMMGFVVLKINNCLVNGIIFSSRYCRISDMFDTERHQSITIEGKKDEKGSIIISKAS